MKEYNHKQIEKKWARFWEKEKIYKTKEGGNAKKFYVLDMFPYPSGAGLHVGHPKGYIATDVVARLKMMQGYIVLHPMGWDAFGLPAENYAIKNKVHPSAAVKKNIATFKKQLGLLGFTYDWDREINTTDPEYYRWTQWIFLEMFKKGLAFESYEPINWCPECKTGLANEDLEGGLCERCGSAVEQKPMRQWVLRITDYAERLLKDLDRLTAWPEPIKEMQRNWIGRSEGALVKFTVRSAQFTDILEVFTTRPDTLFGATYCVVAPEHALISNEQLTINNRNEVAQYVAQAKKKSVLERILEWDKVPTQGRDARFSSQIEDLEKIGKKTGVELKGVKAINPVNGEELPIFVADYVLTGYGTGAIMAVPAHDERDFEFAKKYNLPIKEVVIPNRIDIKNPPVAGKKTGERKNVHALVRDPKSGKFLALKSKKFHWVTFPMGGVEEGEDVVTAAKREVEEETGYKHLKLIKILGGEVRAEYFAKHKDENRVAYTTGILFDLVDDEKSPVEKEWAEEHEMLWIEKERLNYNTLCHAEMDDWERRLNGEEVYTEEGMLINSGEFTKMLSTVGREKIIAWLEEKKLGQKKIQYKLRDWVFSRQRYWGEPIPLIHCDKCGVVAVPEKDLPVELPKVKSYAPTGTGESPLADIEKWVNTKCPKCGGPAKRETNTMPQWAGSCWYYLAYIMRGISNFQFPISKYKEAFAKWLPVDLYVGGAEHATRHLIYARFWHKFLFDIGAVSHDEPFTRLQNVGLILAEDGRKMSKRWGNVINPDDIVKEYGADSMRLYEMFMGPFDQPCAWNTQGLVGMRRFLEKVWVLKEKMSATKKQKSKIETLLHQTIKKVTEDIEAMRYNTAISQMMILVNEITKESEILSTHYSLLIKLLAPFAPHFCEELWSSLGNKKSIFTESWPKFDESLLKNTEITLAVQVNGKLRDTLTVPAEISEEEAKQLALAKENVKKWLEGKTPKKIIYVKGKLISIVV